MLQSRWQNFGSRAKQARCLLKFGKNWWHHIWCGKWCRQFRPNFSTHLAGNTKFSKFLLVGHPTSLNFYISYLDLLSTRASASFQLQLMFRHVYMITSEWTHCDRYGYTLCVPAVSNKSFKNLADANIQMQNVARRMLQQNADTFACWR